MTSRVVYAGPSLAWSDRDLFADVRFLPPIGEGDLFQFENHLPDIVGIVDGFFKNQLAIFHKEIIWMMSKGVRIYGAGSMGALRASELSGCGMIGVGSIFEDYCSGALIDDGDVAVTHAPEELGFKPLTIPVVDVIATSRTLEAAGKISASSVIGIVAAARSIPFQDRTWERIGAEAKKKTKTNLSAMLANAHVHRKRLDALKMLQLVAADEHERANTTWPFNFFETPGFADAQERARARRCQASL